MYNFFMLVAIAICCSVLGKVMGTWTQLDLSVIFLAIFADTVQKVAVQDLARTLAGIFEQGQDVVKMLMTIVLACLVFALFALMYSYADLLLNSKADQLK